MEPEISVIIPSYNSESTLCRCIESVLSQAFNPKEIILVDDGSTDQTAELVKQYFSVQYIHQENQGVSVARNRGAREAKGDYLLFLDSDDEVNESWISDFHLSLVDQPDLVFCNMKLITSRKQDSKETDSQKNKGSVIPGAWMIRKEVFENLEGYDERLKFAENTELFFRMDRHPLKKHYIEGENLIYHQSSDGGSKNLQNMLDSIHIILEKHDDYLNAHVKHLYYQNIGVIEMRFGNFGKARKHLWKSLTFKSHKISTVFRLGISYFPVLARRFYPLEIPKA